MGFRAYNSKGVDKNGAKSMMGFRAYNSKAKCNMEFRAYNSKGVDKNGAKCNMGFRAYNSKGVDKNGAKCNMGFGRVTKIYRGIGRVRAGNPRFPTTTVHQFQWPRQLRAGPLLAQTGCGEGHSISGGGSCARQAISAHKTHHGCVHCQWSTPEDPQTVNVTSMRLKSPGFGTARSKSRIIRLVATSPPPSLHMRATALSTAKSRRAKTPDRAHAARWWPKATPADARRQGNGKAKSAAEKGPETERIDPRQWIGGSGRQESTRTGTTLRTQHRLLRVCEPWEEVQRPELLLHSRSLALPTLPRAARFVVLRVARGRTNSCGQTSPRWNDEPMDTSKRSGSC